MRQPSVYARPVPESAARSLAMCTSIDIAFPLQQAFDVGIQACDIAKWCNVITRSQAVACTTVSSVDSS